MHARAIRIATIASALAIAVTGSASASDGSTSTDNKAPATVVGPVSYPLASATSPISGSITMTGDPKRGSVTSKLRLSSPSDAKGHVSTWSCAADTCWPVATQRFTLRAGVASTVTFETRVSDPRDYPYVQQLVFDDTSVVGTPTDAYETVLFVQQGVPSWPTLRW